MKRLFLPLLMVALLAAGCVSFDSQKFGMQVQKWVPLGTPEADARRIMQKHGFDCEVLSKDHPFNHTGIECLDCQRLYVWMHTWTTQLFLQDGKVSGYGPANVE